MLGSILFIQMKKKTDYFQAPSVYHGRHCSYLSSCHLIRENWEVIILAVGNLQGYFLLMNIFLHLVSLVSQQFVNVESWKEEEARGILGRSLSLSTMGLMVQNLTMGAWWALPPFLRQTPMLEQMLRMAGPGSLSIGRTGISSELNSQVFPPRIACGTQIFQHGRYTLMSLIFFQLCAWGYRLTRPHL